MTRRTILRCLGAYALVAALGVPAGWALARTEPASAAASAGGPVSLGPVYRAASSSAAAKDPVDSHTFTMSGSVSGLVPGRWVTLPVLVNNPNSQTIKVLTVSVTARDASAACPAAGNLAVAGYDSTAGGSTAYLVPGHGSTVVPLPLQLVNTNKNQNACKRVSFGLSYAGTAMQWGN
jgi:hypothetical protein